jgi:hypothetical protein
MALNLIGNLHLIIQAFEAAFEVAFGAAFEEDIG